MNIILQKLFRAFQEIDEYLGYYLESDVPHGDAIYST